MVQITKVAFNKEQKTVTVEARDIDREEWFALLLDDEQKEVLPVIKTRVYNLTDAKDRSKFSTMLDYCIEDTQGQSPIDQIQQLVGQELKFLS